MTSPPADRENETTAPALDHIGIAVPSLEQALEFWQGALGIAVDAIESVPQERVRVAFLDTGAVETELLEATDASSAIARFLASGRKGIHHVAYRVADIDIALASLAARGVPLIHEEAVPGSRGTRIAFVHPRASGGVLVELVEHPKTGPETDEHLPADRAIDDGEGER